MRTRFLGTDCFFSKSKSQILSNSLLNPLYLHAPELCDSDSDPKLDFEFTSFSICEEISLEYDITGFRIDNALSELFSDLIPRFQHVEAVDQPVLFEKELADLLFGESIEAQDARFREDVCISKPPHEAQLEKKLQFDIMELDLPQRQLVTLTECDHGLELSFPLPNIKIPLGIIELDLEITVPYQENLLESIYKTEKIPFEFEDSSSNHKDSSTNSTFNYTAKIPKFELKDSIQDQDTSITKSKPFNSLLSIVDLVNKPHKNDFDELSLSPSKNFDILSYISKEPESLPCDDDPKPIALNSVLDMDLINLNDNILINKNAAIYPLKPDGTYADSPCSVPLQEIEIIEFTYNNTPEIFIDLKPMDIDNDEEFLKESVNFYESILSSELALVDETFKSLPTPIISGEKLKISINIIMDEIMGVMKPCLNSVSDEIYLDWHLMIQGVCDNQICSKFITMVEELNDYNLENELKFSREEDDKIDIIGLLEGNLDKIKVNNFDEVICKAHIGFDEKIVENSSKEKEVNNNGEKISSLKASMLFESMCQANDLNFFLGARKKSAKIDVNVLPEPVFIPKGPEKLTHPSNNNPSIKIPSLINPNSVQNPKPNSLSDIVIIVNTQSIEKPMLTSRRSSYQKLLNLEKNGAQVIERAVNLSLDLVFSAGVCLVWYEMGTFKKSGMNMNEAPSPIQIFIENIATNVLMSLSYSFSGCIMIFEGEMNMLTAVMEYSDTLYSASANLDMNLQLLCSHTSESTDDIIMTCITNLSSPTHSPFPPVPESETLAESFLTKFPSINPLSAHAILSTGGTLVDFLEWSNERRVESLGRYRVSNESVCLFSALCRFGEIGESKSVMTTESCSIGSDLSSSVKRTKFSHELVNDELFGGNPFKFDDEMTKKKKSVSSIVDDFIGRKKGIITSSKSDYMDVELNEEVAFNSEISNFAFKPDSTNYNKPNPRNCIRLTKPGFGNYSVRSFPSSAELDEENTSDWNSRKQNHGLDFSGNAKPGPARRFEFLGGGETEKRSSSSSSSSSTSTSKSTGSRSKETYCKTKSPSIIDRYRHQGSKEAGAKLENYRFRRSNNNTINPIKQKWKDFKFPPTQIPNSSERNKDSDSVERQNQALVSQTLTPVDKRARQNLSFTRQGKAKQSKLVWRNKDSPSFGVGLGKRSREDGRFHNNP